MSKIPEWTDGTPLQTIDFRMRVRITAPSKFSARRLSEVIQEGIEEFAGVVEVHEHSWQRLDEVVLPVDVDTDQRKE